MSRSVKVNPWTKKKEPQRTYRKSKKNRWHFKKGNRLVKTQMSIDYLMKLWDDPLNLQEVADRAWDEFILKELYGYY